MLKFIASTYRPSANNAFLPVPACFEAEVRCETGRLFPWRRFGHNVAGFRQVNKGRSNIHHYALEFPDGRIVLLAQLCRGQHATVLQLPVTSLVTANEAQRYGSLVA